MKNIAGKNKLVIFDLDGTLVELWDVHVIVYEKTFLELYGVANVNFLKEGYVPEGPAEKTVRKVLKNRGYGDAFIESKINFVSATMAKHYPEAIKTGKVNVLPGVIPLLEKLAGKNVLQGVVTGAYSEVAKAILEKADLLKYFEFVVTADDSKDGTR